MPDHVHIVMSIPPKYAVSQVAGYFKGKSAIHLGTGLRGEEAQLHMAALLGERILRLDRGTRRGGDQGVHQKTGTGGHTPGSTEHVSLTGHPSGGPTTSGIASAAKSRLFFREELASLHRSKQSILSH